MRVLYSTGTGTSLSNHMCHTNYSTHPAQLPKPRVAQPPDRIRTNRHLSQPNRPTIGRLGLAPNTAIFGIKSEPSAHATFPKERLDSAQGRSRRCWSHSKDGDLFSFLPFSFSQGWVVTTIGRVCRVTLLSSMCSKREF